MFVYIPVNAEESHLDIYPLPAILSSNNISPQFNQLLTEKRNDFINGFIEPMKANFPNITETFSDRTKYKTFVAYMTIPRVSANEYLRGELVDIYLPMTVSIHFANAATGEILYSYPFTEYSKYKTTKANIENSTKVINELYMQTYNNLAQYIVKKSAEEFKPFSIDVKVIDTYRNIYILDKGSTDGIVKGDLLSDPLGNQISVIFSDLNYSVAEKMIGNINRESIFSKYATGSIAQVKKPKVLLVNNLNNAMAYNLFITALGNSAEFSLITVDKTFYEMQEVLVSLNDDFKTENMQNRTLPEYFLELNITNPLYTRYPTNKDYCYLDKYSVIAGASLYDNTGRIVFTKCIYDEIIDNNVADMKFTNEARFDVLLKNALLKLAEAFSKEVKFKEAELKIFDIKGNYIYLEDPNGLLNIGKSICIFRRIKTELKGNEILIPVWEYKVESNDGRIAVCKRIQPIIDNVDYPTKKDIALVNTLNKGKVNSKIFHLISDKMTFKGNEIEITDFKNIGFLALASSMTSPISTNIEKFKEYLKELNSGYGFKKTLEFQDTSSDLTIRVGYKVNLIKETLKNNLLNQEYNITVGIVSKNGETVIKQEGINQNVTIQIPSEDNKEIIAQELLKFIQQLIQQIGPKF